MYLNQKIVVATMHSKEDVIQPLIESALNCLCFVPNDFDTDLFGTFSGEIDRKLSPLETLKAKCNSAMEKTNCDIGIASEGSFGPHPSMFFAHADEELLIFIDKKNDIEIVVKELSLDTNFYATYVETENELLKLAKILKFPSHGLILRKNETETVDVIKGIILKKELLESFAYLKCKYDKVYVETDMRAMYNPTRMGVIKQTTLKLIKSIQTQCPNCLFPGFSVLKAEAGLTCSCCKLPTKSIISHTYKCKKCSHTENIKYPNNKTFEDPMYCGYCNP